LFEKLVCRLSEWIKKEEGLFDPAAYGLRNVVTKGKVLLKDYTRVPNEEHVFSGGEIVGNLLEEFGISAAFVFDDGAVADKEVVGHVKGNSYNLLICERTSLNVLSLMSATATRTRRLVNIIKSSAYDTRLAATRKTVPLFGDLQKLAVLHGGGDTHRLNLSETAMIKDNHKKLYGSISIAVTEVRKTLPFTKKIEVEVESEEELKEALGCGADVVMLDNFSAEEARRLAKLAKSARVGILVEVSGGVDEQNIIDYLCDEVDVVSVGKLTSEVEYVDYSLEIE